MSMNENEEKDIERVHHLQDIMSAKIGLMNFDGYVDILRLEALQQWHVEHMNFDLHMVLHVSDHVARHEWKREEDQRVKAEIEELVNDWKYEIVQELVRRGFTIKKSKCSGEICNVGEA